jgi:SAM-dependent methyltransferase
MFLNYPDSCGLTGSGAYDRLYARDDFLWSARPGRMVTKGASLRPPGRALDAGCGDGKNSLFLLRHGWSVDAFDISMPALTACRRRLDREHGESFRIWHDDCRTAALKAQCYDMVVAYGLYHCLDDRGLEETHSQLTAALKKGGLFICATFNNRLPLPSGHATGPLQLRPHDHVESLFPSWREIALEKGTIEEDHQPLVGPHRHSLTWAIYEKIR